MTESTASPNPPFADGSPSAKSWNHTLLALTLIGLLTAFRLAYIFLWCPYDLAPDEAHYWDWSRHLDWSYYSKGPLIAWLIRGGVELFGDLSLATQGTLTAAVRVPAVLCGGLFLWGVFRLARGTMNSDKTAFYCVTLAAIMPPVNVCSLIMTIDAPYLTCWVWAMVFGFEAVRDDRRWQWLATGLIVALGILAKYTMALWLGSFVLFLFLDPSRRQLLVSKHFGLMALMASLSALPILIWNSSHDWVTFRHVAGQAGVNGAQTQNLIRWTGPIEFVSEQTGLLLGYWNVMGVLAAWATRPWKGVNSSVRYLWWMSIPTMALFMLVSLRAHVQINWPAGAYVGGLVLIVDFLRRSLPTYRERTRKIAVGALSAFLVAGLIGSVMIHDTSLLTRFVAPMLPPDSPDQPLRIRKIDAAARLKGWRHLAGEIDRIRREVRQTGEDDPVIAAFKWDVPGEIGVYCEDRPPVYSLGLAMGDRHSQHDWWRPNPVADAQEFRGKTFLFVGVHGVEHVLEKAFDRVGAPLVVTHREGDRAMTEWRVWVCRGYQGFGNLPALPTAPRH